MNITELAGTTDALGDLVITSTQKQVGYIEKIVMVYDDGDTGADVVVTAEDATSEPVLTKATLGTADVVWYPRTPANKVADGSAFTNVAEKIFVGGSTYKVVVDDGGNAKNFRFLIYTSDE